MKYIALLRGINVGGNNIIKMSDLKHAFTVAGYQNVTTYIQSGNVIFDSNQDDFEILTKNLELLLSDKFNYQAQIVLITQDQLKSILSSIPGHWRLSKDIRCYIAFLKPPLMQEEAIGQFSPKDGVDFVHKGPGVIYMTTLTSGLSKSGFTKLTGSKIYKQITIRNLNTTQKLNELMDIQNVNQRVT